MQGALDLRHQIGILEDLPKRLPFFAEHAFPSAQRFKQDIQQLRVATKPPSRSLAVTFKINHLFERSSQLLALNRLTGPGRFDAHVAGRLAHEIPNH